MRSLVSKQRLFAFSKFPITIFLVVWITTVPRSLAGDPVIADRLVVEMAGASAAPLIWHEDFNAGWATAKETGRPMLIFITMEECKFCDAMKENTLCNRTIAEKLSQRFVSIRLNRRKDSEVLSRIVLKTYPTTLVALPQGKVVGHREGYQPPAELAALLAEASPERMGR